MKGKALVREMVAFSKVATVRAIVSDRLQVMRQARGVATMAMKATTIVRGIID